MPKLRPSLLLVLFGAVPFLSIRWDHEKGGGVLGSKKEETRRMNRGRGEMLLGEEDQKGPEKMPEKENIKEEEGSKKEKKVEGSLGEDLDETKTKVKEKAGHESEDLRLSWVALKKKMLKDLEMKVPDEDPKQEMADLEDHLVEVKERATVWQGLAKERLTIMDRSNVPREGEGKRKIGNMKKKNKGNGLRGGFPKMTGVANTTNDGTKKKNQTRIFPLQSFTKVPSASKFWIKHRKNCECCPVSQLIVRSQILS